MIWTYFELVEHAQRSQSAERIAYVDPPVRSRPGITTVVMPAGEDRADISFIVTHRVL
jgi:hypothetical protein